MLAIGLSVAYAQTQNGNAYPIDLQTTLRLAGAQNLDIRIARSELQKARANRLMAWEKFLPWLAPGAVFDMRNGMGVSTVSGAIDEGHYAFDLPGLTIEGHVPVGDAIFNVLAKKQLVRASRNALDAQWQDSLLSASVDYFDTLEAKARADIEREMEGISAKYQRELHEAVAIGIAFKGLELIVQTETVRYGIALRLWLQHQRDASAKLTYTLNMDSSIELVPESADLMPIMLFDTQTPLETLMQQAYSARPELKEMQDLVAAARADRNGAIYGPIIPTLSTNMFFGSLNGGWEPYNAPRSTNSIDSGQKGFGLYSTTQRYPGGRNGGASNDILFGVNWRIGPGGLGDIGKIRETTARLDTARLRSEKMLDEVNRQVVENHTRIRSYYDQVRMARANVKTAREVLRLVTGRQEFGIDKVLEVIKAEQGLEQAYNDYVIAMAEFNKSQYRLSRAVGGLLPSNAR